VSVTLRDTILQDRVFCARFPYVTGSRTRQPAGRRRSQDDPQMPHPFVPSVSELRRPNFEELGNHEWTLMHTNSDRLGSVFIGVHLWLKDRSVLNR
jgi:hypothetical protein